MANYTDRISAPHTDGGRVSPRTAVLEAILSGVSAELDDDAVRGLENVSLSATEAACQNSEPLLDWNEYQDVEL
jgi:hypothetical protein